MKEATIDLWEAEADARVITTNGTIARSGRAVMGKGCAREAANMCFGVDLHLGHLLAEYGNVPVRLAIDFEKGADLLTFPVKHNWWEKADLELIQHSAISLVKRVNMFGYRNVVLPRPGCGAGGLLWKQVKPVIEPLLDERFTVVSK